MTAPVFSTLANTSAVTDLVSTRIYEDVAPQNVSRPYVVWQEIGGSAENYLSETPGIDYARIQIDCYAESKSLVRAIAIAVRDALDLQGYQIGNPRSDFSASTKLFSVSMDYSFWVTR